MSGIATASLRLTERKEVLDRLRRIGTLRKDAEGREYYETRFDGNPIPFWIGQIRALPQEWAESIESTEVMPMDEKCKQCKGTGSVVTGFCAICKGTGMVDTGQMYKLFKIVDRADPLALDPRTYQTPPSSASVSEEKPKAVSLLSA